MHIARLLLHVSVLAAVLADFGDRQGRKRFLPPSPRRIAIVVPLRDRWEHARIFHQAMLKHDLADPEVIFKMFYVEQTKLGQGHRFNRGMMFNFGLVEALKSDFAPDCIVIHDVDMIPVGDVAYAHCRRPTHLFKANAVPFYQNYIGAVFSASPAHWRLKSGLATVVQHAPRARRPRAQRRPCVHQHRAAGVQQTLLNGVHLGL